MQRRLYSNIQRMTTVFWVSILCVTLSLLTLRLTVFSDMAPAAQPAFASGENPASEDESPQGGMVGGESFPYQIRTKIYFSKPDAKGNVLISNPETNKYYMSVDILLADTRDSVLFTGFIKPGEARESMRLTRELKDGVYECEAEITAYDPDTLDEVGSLTQSVTLYIGEKP